MVIYTVDSTRFNAGLVGLIQDVGLEGKTVVKKEMGELIKTLVRFSPPKRLAPSRARIAKFIRSKFEAMNKADIFTGQRTTKHGKGDVLWMYSTPSRLFGIGQGFNALDASVEELKQIALSTDRKGRFRGQRGKQHVLISRWVTTRKRTLDKLIRHLQDNLGRLKAGWLVSVFTGDIQISGVNLPPAWVTKHAGGAKGRFVNGLNDKIGKAPIPSFMIANSARGISEDLTPIVQNALDTRAKAMEKNMQLFFSGKKQLSDYAKSK